MSDAAAALAIQPPMKKRRAWLAFLLGLAAPGLGHFYNTQFRRARFFLGAWATAVAVFCLYRLVVSPTTLAALVAYFLLILPLLIVPLAAAFDAAVGARRVGQAALSRWHWWIVYAGLWIAQGLVVTLATDMAKDHGKWEAYNIPNGSMQPGLGIGDRLFAWKNYYAAHEPVRGDLIVFKLPRDGKTDFVKRLVGMPGERIQMKGGRLHINDVPVTMKRVEDYAEKEPSQAVAQYEEVLPDGISRPYLVLDVIQNSPLLDDTTVFTVPAGHFFFLGDNRDHSLDSRMPEHVGYVPRANLRDRPMLFYWSATPGRFGQPVQPAP